MEKRDLEPDEHRRARHACWAMPGAVALILLMIFAFAAQFGEPVTGKQVRPAEVVLAGSTEAGTAARSAVAASRH